MVSCLVVQLAIWTSKNEVQVFKFIYERSSTAVVITLYNTDILRSNKVKLCASSTEEFSGLWVLHAFAIILSNFGC